MAALHIVSMSEQQLIVLAGVFLLFVLVSVAANGKRKDRLRARRRRERSLEWGQWEYREGDEEHSAGS